MKAAAIKRLLARGDRLGGPEVAQQASRDPVLGFLFNYFVLLEDPTEGAVAAAELLMEEHPTAFLLVALQALARVRSAEMEGVERFERGGRRA